MMLPSPQKYGFVLPPGLPGEAGISTFVESPLQISSFLTNKANFPDTQMNVSRVPTKDYENKTPGERGKNKPNSKPIQTQTKPISEKAKMNVTSIITKGYENKPPLPAPAKQTQYKPNFKGGIIIKNINIEVADPAFRGRNQTQSVVSLPAMPALSGVEGSLLVLSIVEGSKGSNLFQTKGSLSEFFLFFIFLCPNYNPAMKTWYFATIIPDRSVR